MKKVNYITGNPKKAEYLAKYLGHPVEHKKIDLDEIQSLDLKEVIEHKLKQAYEIVKGPVLVEDTSLEFKVFGKLPGTFIKFFELELGYEKICRLLDGQDRNATGRCMFGYFDGEKETFFEGSIQGTISENPRGSDGFGFNCILIPEGFDKTMAEMNEAEFKKTYLTIKPIEKVAEFLKNL